MANQAKHTPGPWVAVIPTQRMIHEGSDITNYTVYSKRTRGELRELGYTHYREDESCVDNVDIADAFIRDLPLEEFQANARLIASAPTLAAENTQLYEANAKLRSVLRYALPILEDAASADSECLGVLHPPSLDEQASFQVEDMVESFTKVLAATESTKTAQ